MNSTQSVVSRAKPPLILMPYLRFEKWWNQTIAPFMPIFPTLLVMLLGVNLAPNEMTVGVLSMLAVILLISWSIAKIKPLNRAIQRNKLVVALTYAPFAIWFASPAFAQLEAGNACAGSGIFNPVAEFTISVFENFNVASNEDGIGGIPQFICGLLAFIVVAVIIAFLVIGITVGIRISNGNMTEIVNPIVGLGFFVVFATVGISFLIGAN